MAGRAVVDLVNTGRFGGCRCSNEKAFQKKIIGRFNY
jgi:hypothetical protein